MVSSDLVRVYPGRQLQDLLAPTFCRIPEVLLRGPFQAKMIKIHGINKQWR
jgi:hypothetical protein